MPIRFYCPFCNQLLGIATRKAGTVIHCPRCHGEVGVPSQSSPEKPALSPGKPLSALLVDVELAPLTPAILLSSNQVGLLLLSVVVLLTLAFLSGLIVGALR